MSTALSKFWKHSDITLSVDTRTAAVLAGSATNNLAIKSTKANVAGKLYLEALLVSNPSANNLPRFGLINELVTDDFAVTTHAVAGPNVWSINDNGSASGNGTTVSAGVTFATGDRMQIAVDIAAQKIWFGKNNMWVLGGNPATGASPTFNNLAGAGFWPALSLSRVTTGDEVVTVALRLVDFFYAPPAGFSEWGEGPDFDIVSLGEDRVDVSGLCNDQRAVNVPYITNIRIRGAPRPEDVQTPPRSIGYAAAG